MNKIYSFSVVSILAILFLFSSNNSTNEIKTLSSLSPGDLLITEIMHRPSAVPDQYGEYFEIFNKTGFPINMQNFVIADEGFFNTMEIFTPVIINPGQHMVFGPSNDPELNGNTPVDFVYSYAGFQLDDSGDAIFLFDASFNLIDVVIYDNGDSFPNIDGLAMSLDPESCDPTANDWGGNWCPETEPYGDGDGGTPGYENNEWNDPMIAIIDAPSVRKKDCTDKNSRDGNQLGDHGGY